MEDCILEASGYQAMRMAELMMRYSECNARGERLDCWWFWGKNSESCAWAKGWEVGQGRVYTPVNEKWWDGYDAHSTVVITDIDYIPKLNIKKLTSPFPLRVETKGGSRQGLWEHIIFASKDHPRALNIDNEILKNRFKIVYCGNEVGGNTNPDNSLEKKNECECSYSDTPEEESEDWWRHVLGETEYNLQTSKETHQSR